MCELGYCFRYAGFQKWKKTIDEAGGYDKFTRGYESFGFIVSDKGITYREWAPNATGAYLFGEFSKELSTQLHPHFFYPIEMYMFVLDEDEERNHFSDHDNARQNR